MNSRKYDGILYPVRETRDLRDIVMTSARMFKNKTAYLVKDRPKGKFVPITYEKVGKDVESLGTRLIDLGLKGEKIAVIGESSYKWILTYFATVSGVGVIVPLDKNLPEEELEALIKRSGAKAIVYSKKMESKLKKLFETPYNIEYFISMAEEEHKGKVYSFSKLIKEGEHLLENGIRDFVDESVEPNQMATLMFTSGTTGMAKGVMLSQENIASNVKNMSKYVHLKEDMVVLSILPIHHAYEMTCVIWTTFYQGKTIAICEGIKYIQKNMVEVGAGCMVGVPLVFEKMHKGMWKQAESRGEAQKLRKAIDLSRKLKLYNKPNLMKKLFKAIHQTMGGNMSLFISGGAAIDPKVIEDFEAMGIPMIQGYGMSENAPIIAVNQDRYSIASSVGRPLPETEVKIVNKDDTGVGEIWCKGPSVMLGYYENKEATEETLVDGWLNTGDLGYLDDKGFLYVTGRKKTVIVTKGGKNIYPEEIESLLLEEPLISEVIVHGVSDKAVGNTIIAVDIYPNYSLLEEEKGKLNSGEIYQFYRQIIDDFNKKLPPYKNIKRVNIRETEFAKTTTGKIKRFGNFQENGENQCNQPENMEKRYAEGKAIKSYIKSIMESPLELENRDVTPVVTVKDILKNSSHKWGENLALISMDENLTYSQLQNKVNALGTALINRGYKNKKFLFLGEMDMDTYQLSMAVLSGLGTLIYANENLEKEELLKLEDKADVVILGGLPTEKTKELLAKLKPACVVATEKSSSLALGEEREILLIDDLLEEGKNQVSTGDRQMIDLDVNGEDQGAIFYYKKDDEVIREAFTQKAISKKTILTSMTLDYKEKDIVSSKVEGVDCNNFVASFLSPMHLGATVTLGVEPLLTKAVLEKYSPSLLVLEEEGLQQVYREMLENVNPHSLEKINHRGGIHKFARTFGIDLCKTYYDEVISFFGGNLREIIILGKVVGEELEFIKKLPIRVVYNYQLSNMEKLVSTYSEEDFEEEENLEAKEA